MMHKTGPALLKYEGCELSGISMKKKPPALRRQARRCIKPAVIFPRLPEMPLSRLTIRATFDRAYTVMNQRALPRAYKGENR
jgi:hypothetical protein